MGDFLYFYGGDQVHGYELWRTDGTPTGTMMIKDIMPGSGNSYVANLTASEDKLYFFADDGLHGYELWRSDGTMNGTVLVKDIIPSIQPSVDIFPGTNIVIINDTIFFVAQDGYHGYELWKSDGTANGTFMVKDGF
jgi:ELWxxDGT repeat protein